MDYDELAKLIDLGGAGATGERAGQAFPTESLFNQISVEPPPPSPGSTPLSSQLTGFVPTLVSLAQDISKDLTQGQQKLLSLNRSRRDELCQHLQRLSGLQGPAADDLGLWLSSLRTSAQTAALNIYFEEIALFILGQALVLKTWSDRGLRKMDRADLSNLNWTMSNHLKRFVPPNRDGWQITRPNVYSWYLLSQDIQARIWESLQLWNLQNESSAFLIQVLRATRRLEPPLPENRGLDMRFFSALWDNLKRLGIDVARPRVQGPIQRSHTVFSPTLRDGAIVRTAPGMLAWAGAEADPFLLCLCELSILWGGPFSPPIWTTGSGLELHPREQLSMSWSSSRASNADHLAELESCDLAIVQEERAIRVSSRGVEGSRLRRQLEFLPYFKKLKSEHVSLGGLQAAVALSKLRPGGILVWLRDEALHPGRDGTELAHSLLERARLVAQWDLASVNHTLPSPQPLFPKHVLVFVRELDIYQRAAWKPLSIQVLGNIRSHVEVQLFLSDVFASVSSSSTPSAQRSGWHIVRTESSATQQEWLQHWPEVGGVTSLETMDRLRKASTPMGQMFLIRTGSHSHTQQQSLLTSEWGRATGPIVYVWQENSESGLKTDISDAALSGKASVFQVLLHDASAVPLVRWYLESKTAQNWLNTFVERRRNLWTLREETLKILPFPNALAETLRSTEPSPALRELEALLDSAPRKAVTGAQTPDLAAGLFARAARLESEMQRLHAPLLQLVNSEGSIRWAQFLRILPSAERTSFPLHPQLRVTGSLPLHVPIHQIRMIRVPRQSVLFATETGLTASVACIPSAEPSDENLFMEILWSQVQGLQHPTWSEIVQHVSLPRASEFVRTTANEILREHALVVQRLGEIANLRDTLAEKLY